MTCATICERQYLPQLRHNLGLRDLVAFACPQSSNRHCPGFAGDRVRLENIGAKTLQWAQRIAESHWDRFVLGSGLEYLNNDPKTYHLVKCQCAINKLQAGQQPWQLNNWPATQHDTPNPNPKRKKQLVLNTRHSMNTWFQEMLQQGNISQAIAASQLVKQLAQWKGFFS